MVVEKTAVDALPETHTHCTRHCGTGTDRVHMVRNA
jgi:hypothetical protein